MEHFLTSETLAPEIPPEADIYGWLVGSWKLRVMVYQAIDLSAQQVTAEAHFARVLEGRAIQDIWIMHGKMYGTTVRSWDPALGAWRITWINPLASHYESQLGRRIGQDIVQLGTRPNGTATKWRFTEITPRSFHWIGEALEPDGGTWRTEGEFLATREK